MTITEIIDQKTWNELLLSQSTQSGIFLQSFEWGEFQKAVGRRVYRYQTHGGFAQVIELPLPMGKKYWFIPRGTMITELEQEARKRGALFMRVEPLTKLQEVTGGYRRLQEVTAVHPKQTIIIDLNKSEEDLLAGMHEKTRYNIRLALKKGVRCQVSGVSEFGKFWELMQETAKRDGFTTHDRKYYEILLQVLQPSPGLRPPSPMRGEGTLVQFPSPRGRGEGEDGVMSARLHIAYSGPTPLAAAIVGYFGDTATYLHGASSYEHRALMGPYALHWNIMQEAKKIGYRWYDFWGIAKGDTSKFRKAKLEASPFARWAGITRFKMGFGGRVVDYPGTFDLPLNRFWYTVYRLGRKVL